MLGCPTLHSLLCPVGFALVGHSTAAVFGYGSRVGTAYFFGRVPPLPGPITVANVTSNFLILILSHFGFRYRFLYLYKNLKSSSAGFTMMSAERLALEGLEERARPTLRAGAGAGAGYKAHQRLDPYTFGKACVRVDRLLAHPDYPTTTPILKQFYRRVYPCLIGFFLDSTSYHFFCLCWVAVSKTLIPLCIIYFVCVWFAFLKRRSAPFASDEERGNVVAEVRARMAAVDRFVEDQLESDITCFADHPQVRKLLWVLVVRYHYNLLLLLLQPQGGNERQAGLSRRQVLMYHAIHNKSQQRVAHTVPHRGCGLRDGLCVEGDRVVAAAVMLMVVLVRRWWSWSWWC